MGGGEILQMKTTEVADVRLEEAVENETALRCGHGGPEKAGDCLRVMPCNPVQAGIGVQRPGVEVPSSQAFPRVCQMHALPVPGRQPLSEFL